MITPKHISAEIKICLFSTLKRDETLEKNTANNTTAINSQLVLIHTAINEDKIVATAHKKVANTLAVAIFAPSYQGK